MQKLTLLIVTMLISLTAFSQNVTPKDSSIILPKPIAKLVVKDLIKKDSLESEMIIVKKNQSLLQTNLLTKDSIIKSQSHEIEIFKIKDELNQSILGLTNQQKANLKDDVDNLTSQVKSLNRKLAVRTTGAAIIIGLLVYMIVK